jgi:choline-sulfatase
MREVAAIVLYRCFAAGRLRLPGMWLLVRAALLVTTPSLHAWAAKPNVVLITIDTLRADHVGCYGDRQALTPTLDDLARQGVLFRTAVAQVPLTLPSHCSIMTGTYPTFHGVRDNLGYVLAGDPPTLAAILKQNGYDTAAFVGAEVLDARRGLNHGFDTYSSPFRRKIGRDNPLVFNLQELRRPAEAVVNDALGWMNAQRRGQGKPFFVWIHLYDPHQPYEPPEPFRTRLNDRYNAEIAYSDDAIGKFFEYLRDHALYDKTLIIATSDHGESLGEHGEKTHGYFIYDSTLLVPLIIKAPAGAGIPARRIDTAVRSIDIAPTVLQLAGIPSPTTIQGAGLLSLMEGKAAASREDFTYCETFYPAEFGWSALRALRITRYKYIDAPRPELYDLQADPHELHDIAGTRRDVALQLKSQLSSLVDKASSKSTAHLAAVSPGDTEMMASLGYVGVSGAPATNGPNQPGRNPLPFFPSTYVRSVADGRNSQALRDPKDELTAYVLMTSATQLASVGDCVRALPMLTRLTQMEPHLVVGQLTLGKCDLALERFTAADTILNTVLRLSPDNLEAKFYLGISQFQGNEFKEALANLQPLAQRLPNEPYLHFYLGGIYEKEGTPAQALDEYQKCESLAPNFEVAVYKVGFLLARSGKFTEASAKFKKVTEMDPDNASAHFNLALAYQRSGNLVAARPEFETACKLDPARCAPPNQ